MRTLCAIAFSVNAIGAVSMGLLAAAILNACTIAHAMRVVSPW